ncbi:TonB-dependent siderophore receptor [Colwellia echini]|uniref:TonB-dependent receptor n=1 Tax=Colwellia echini TaxID=1982103 RepID=A0ABY3N000_9GAMM|nr:TonB-dependent receptor [Colwellia echini]TYK66654.1 TonB-dependent receptor [Colwellia echini]
MFQSFKRNKLALLITINIAAVSQLAIAEETKESTPNEDIVELETYTSEGQIADTMGLMPTEAVESVFGFGKTVLETPRGVTTVTSDMMENYNITNIDDLVLVSPGAFTQSFFGVAGSLDVRGTPGEVYFRGIRRINNPGNYPTPIGASSRIDIVRGPASPIYGPSKIGGYLNFEPKSARADTGQYLEEPTGKISLTRGSWEKNILTAEVGGPGKIGDKDLGYYFYAETENSGSYYENSATDQNIIQASFNVDLSPDTRIEFGGMYHEFDGNQVAGWNRLTQELIDNGTYVTGSPTSVDLNHDGLNSADEYSIWQGTFNPNSNNFFVPPSSATDASLDPEWALNNVGTAKLEHNQVLVADSDYLTNTVSTLYFDVMHQIADGFTLTNKMFYEDLDNANANAYGFSQFADTYAFEDQLVLAYAATHTDWLSANYQVSPSIRYTNFKHGDDYDFEYFDRRDLTGPSTALDRKLLSIESDEDYSSYTTGNFTDYGLAFLADFNMFTDLNILLGVRYDYLDMTSIEHNNKLFGATGNEAPTEASDSDSAISWTASASYNLPGNIVPYITASKQTTIIMGQGSEIPVDLVQSGNALADSTLAEVGVKASLVDNTLFLTLDYFDQERTNYSAQDQVSNNTTRSKGWEFEMRYLVTEQLTLTGNYTNLKVTNLTALETGTQFGFMGAEDLTGITDPSLFYAYVMQGLTLVNDEAEATKAGIPENMFSLTGAYDFQNGLSAMVSVIHADSTFSSFSQGVELPAYTVLNAGITYATGDWVLRVQGKNLTNEKYYRANFPDLFGSTVVLPELPANWVASASYQF